jgi:hypothetical protein
LRFVGIDVAAERQVVAVVDDTGTILLRATTACFITRLSSPSTAKAIGSRISAKLAWYLNLPNQPRNN